MAHPDSTIKVVDQEENGPGASVRTEKVALVSRGKLIDKPSTVINTQGYSDVIKDRSLCGDPQAPSVLTVLRVGPLGPMPQRAVSSPMWSFIDRTWSRA